MYVQFYRQAVKFEGTELEAGVWTVFTCLNGAGRKRNVKAGYQRRVQTRKTQRGNLNKWRQKIVISLSIPYPPSKIELRNTQLRADISDQVHHSPYYATSMPNTCSLLLTASLPHCWVLSHILNTLKALSYTCVPSVFAWNVVDTQKKVTELNLNKALLLNDNSL